MDRFDWMFGTPLPNWLAVVSALLVGVMAIRHRRRLEGPIEAVLVAALLMPVVVWAKNITHHFIVENSDRTGPALLEVYESYAGVLALTGALQVSVGGIFLGFAASQTPLFRSTISWVLLFAGVAASYAAISTAEWTVAYGDGFENGYRVFWPLMHRIFWILLMAIAVMTLARAVKSRKSAR
jgi:hypothetical protein